MTRTGHGIAYAPPTSRQLAALRRIACRRGCTFTPPRTLHEASAEIERLLTFRRRRAR